ncbi:hypothetical protein D3C76_861900 [compost metagenome]
MARSILNVGDQAGVRTVRGIWTQFIKQCAQGVNHFDVLLFVVAADVVRLANHAFGDNLVECPGVILDVKPVTNLVTLTVDRKRLAFQSIEDDQRDQLLGEVARAVVVRAIGY